MKKYKNITLYLSDELARDIDKAYAKAVLYSGYKGNKQDFLRACISGGLRLLEPVEVKREV